MEQDDLKLITNNIVDLPTLPQVVTTLINAINDPYSDATIINNIVIHDPALAAKILKLVNSSFYALSNPVNSIQQAVVILGFKTIRSLAISASVFNLFTGSDFSYEGFWKQSLASGLMLEALARQSPVIEKDSAFITGLLHQIGKIILEQYATEQFNEIIEIAAREKLSFADAEKCVINTSYTNIGYWLTAKWSLSAEIQNSILFQNNIAEASAAIRPLAAGCQFTFQTLRLRKYENGSDFDSPTEIEDELWEILQIPDDKKELIQQDFTKCIDLADAVLADMD